MTAADLRTEAHAAARDLTSCVASALLIAVVHTFVADDPVLKAVAAGAFVVAALVTANEAWRLRNARRRVAEHAAAERRTVAMVGMANALYDARKHISRWDDALFVQRVFGALEVELAALPGGPELWARAIESADVRRVPDERQAIR